MIQSKKQAIQVFGPVHSILAESKNFGETKRERKPHLPHFGTLEQVQFPI